MKRILKRKNNKVRTILIVFALVYSLFQVSARNVYVTATGGAASGDGTPTAPVSFSQFLTILSTHTVGTDATLNVYFQGGTYIFTAPLSFNTTTTNIAGLTTTFDRISDSDIVIFSGNNANHQIINRNSNSASSSSLFTVTFRNIIFENFTKSSVNDASTYRTESFARAGDPGTYSIINFDRVTIRNCNTDAPLFYMYSTGSRINVSNSSIYNNNRGSNSIVHFRYSSNSDYSRFYNNTFSSNTVASCVYIQENTANYTGFFNNTFYNTGDIGLSYNNSNYFFINNIVAGTSTYSLAGTSIVAYCNTQPYQGNLYYNATGNSGGVDITSAFNQQFNKTLTTGTDPGTQVHEILDRTNTNHVIFRKGLTATQLRSYTKVLLGVDQLGNSRSPSDNLSLGTIDDWTYVIRETVKIALSYNSAENIPPRDTTINLLNYIVS